MLSLETILRFLTPLALRLALAIVVILAGRALAQYGRKLLEQSLRHTTLTESMATLLVVLTHYSILIVSVMLGLIILGIPAAGIVGSFGVIVVVLAVALQQSLADLAATINFLLFKPFEVGDIIETGSVLGVVKEIQLFSTVILSPNQKTNVLPNSKVQSVGLANYSKMGRVRLDLVFGIGYDSDVETAKKVIADVLAADKRVLTDPSPKIFIGNLGDSSVDITVWVFVHIGDYFAFQADIVERVKKAFDEAGIIIPYPQQDIHLISGDNND